MLRFEKSAVSERKTERLNVASNGCDSSTASESLAANPVEPMLTLPYSGWNPKSVIGRLRHSWKALVADSPWPAMHAASHIFTAGIVLYLGVAIFLEDSRFSWPLRHCLGISGENLLAQIWLRGALFLIPVAAGVRIGSAFPRRGALGTFFALSIMTIIASPFFLGINPYSNANPGLINSPFRRDNYVLSELIVATVISAPILAGWLAVGGLPHY